MREVVPTWRNRCEDHGPGISLLPSNVGALISGMRRSAAAQHDSRQCLQARGRAARHSTPWVSGLFLAALAFLPIRRLCQRPRGRPRGTDQAGAARCAHRWTVRSQQGFVARGSEGGKKQAHTGEGRAWMGEAIYRPGEERKINTRNQATLHCLQQAYSDPAQVPHRSADNKAGSLS